MANSSLRDPAHIDVYVTPYYNSAGPTVKVGKFSAGLASKDERQFVSTIRAMKKQWNTLNFAQMYVGAIRLYDFGYRSESIYWFYSGQYRGRLFESLTDQDKMGTIGSPGFELFHAADAFQQLVGPYINGYAFGNIDSLMRIVQRVQSENRSVPDMRAIYPNVTFIAKARWNAQNAALNEGLGKMVASVSSQKDQIKQTRVQNGTEAQFSHLSNKPFPGGL